MPVVPVQLPAESLGVTADVALNGCFSEARLSTSRVNVLIDGNICPCGEVFASQGRILVEASMIEQSLLGARALNHQWKCLEVR